MDLAKLALNYGPIDQLTVRRYAVLTTFSVSVFVFARLLLASCKENHEITRAQMNTDKMAMAIANGAPKKFREVSRCARF